jgi:hypothetical protein
VSRRGVKTPHIKLLPNTFQPIRNKERLKIDYDWSKRDGNIIKSRKWKLEDGWLTNTNHLSKKKGLIGKHLQYRLLV